MRKFVKFKNEYGDNVAVRIDSVESARTINRGYTIFIERDDLNRSFCIEYEKGIDCTKQMKRIAKQLK